MHLQYRPKYLPRSRETSAARVARRLGLTKPKATPEPHVAPAALFGEPQRAPYIPGPTLAYSDELGVLLFRDATSVDGVDGIEPAPPEPDPAPPAWSLWLQGIGLAAAILLCGVTIVRLH